MRTKQWNNDHQRKLSILKGGGTKSYISMPTSITCQNTVTRPPPNNANDRLTV